MITQRDDSTTDPACYKGEELQRIASQAPDKWYVSFEHYNRVTENLLLEHRNTSAEMKRLRSRLSLFKLAAFVLAILAAVLLLDRA